MERAILGRSPTFIENVFADAFVGNLVGTANDSNKVGGRQVFVQATAPTINIYDGDIWIQRP